MSAHSSLDHMLPVPAGRFPADLEFRCGVYQLRLAESDADCAAIYRLRFEVFNLELKEGLVSAFLTGSDTDEFDSICDHLLVEDCGTGCVVGTYRLQTGQMAERNLGYYSAREFEFAPYAGLRAELVELGRACIAQEHRTFEVLTLLWRGIAQYAIGNRARYLVGCSSLTSQDAAVGWGTYQKLQNFLADAALRTVPLPGFVLPHADSTSEDCTPPRLLRAYLALGAQICGPPAIDRQFKTIDFLTLLDLNRLSATARERFLGG